MTLTDRVRGRGDRRVESAVRVLRHFQRRFHPVLELGRVGFRHRDVNPHLVNVGDREQRRRIDSVRSDQRTDVDVAGGHHAVERGHDVGERFLRFQPVDIRLSSVDLGGLCTLVAVLFVRGLLRHGG